MTFTDRDKAECAEREAVLRRQVYPNRVAAGRLSINEARWQIQCMEAIAADYRARDEGAKGKQEPLL